MFTIRNHKGFRLNKHHQFVIPIAAADAWLNQDFDIVTCGCFAGNRRRQFAMGCHSLHLNYTQLQMVWLIQAHKNSARVPGASSVV
jgi:hypothetical protein